MSSSKVIKSGSCVEQPVKEFTFSVFHKRGVNTISNCADGFQPFFADAGFQPAGDNYPAVRESDPISGTETDLPGLIRISEEELQSRIQEAFDRGAETERKQADEDLAGICSALAEAISVVSKLRSRIVRESEEELLKLAFMVAKKVIRHEITHDPHILAHLVREALSGFPEQHEIVVSLNPEDYKVITSNRELFLAGIGDDRQITIKPDEATTLGGCIVESSTGVIDARIEAQLDELYKGLVEERSGLGELAECGDASAAASEVMEP